MPRPKRSRVSSDVSSAKRSKASRRRRAPVRRIEVKYYDTAFSANMVAPTDSAGGEYDPTVTSMISTPAQGDTSINRDGAQIRIKNVHVKGSIQRSYFEAIVNPPEAMEAYLALVLDKQTNGAQMNSEDCFTNTTAAAIGATECMRNMAFRSRFQILKSQKFDLSFKSLSHVAADLFSGDGTSIPFDWFIDLKDLVVNFNTGTTASVVNVVDNSLHIIGFCNTVIPAAPVLTYNARIRFTD